MWIEPLQKNISMNEFIKWMDVGLLGNQSSTCQSLAESVALGANIGSWVGQLVTPQVLCFTLRK